MAEMNEEWKRIYKVIPDADKIAEYTGKDEVVSSFEAQKHFERQAAPAYSIKTGLVTLDNMTNGFSPGNLISVTGLTKCGKTSICQTFTQNFSAYKRNSLWFSYEVPALEFMSKFPVLPLFYLPLEMTESNLKWLEKRIQEAIVKYDTKAVFIDHLHYLVPMSATVRMDLMIGAVMRELKKMALRYNIVIFLIAHTKKLSSDKKPCLEDLRDSSFIAQESDFVMAIWRRVQYMEDDKNKEEPIYTNEAKLFLLANRRNGKLGALYLKYKDNLFYEIEKGEYDG